MAYIKRDDLLQSIIQHAILDRVAFMDAVGRKSESAIETRSEIARIKALAGKGMKAALAADADAVRLACVFAELWFFGLADAQIGREREKARKMLSEIRSFRRERFGRTETEAQLANGHGKTVLEILATSEDQ